MALKIIAAEKALRLSLNNNPNFQSQKPIASATDAITSSSVSASTSSTPSASAAPRKKMEPKDVPVQLMSLNTLLNNDSLSTILFELHEKECEQYYEDTGIHPTWAGMMLFQGKTPSLDLFLKYVDSIQTAK